MAEEIDFENGRNSNFEGLVTLTLTFDPAIRHIVLQQSSTSTYVPTFIQIEETFCGRTDVRTDVPTGGRTFFPSILLGRLSEVDLKIHSYYNTCATKFYIHYTEDSSVTWNHDHDQVERDHNMPVHSLYAGQSGHLQSVISDITKFIKYCNH